MSTFTEINNVKTTPLDGPNDLKPQTKTSLILQQEAAAKAPKKTKSTTKK